MNILYHKQNSEELVYLKYLIKSLLNFLKTNLKLHQQIIFKTKIRLILEIVF